MLTAGHVFVGDEGVCSLQGMSFWGMRVCAHCRAFLYILAAQQGYIFFNVCMYFMRIIN